MKRKIAILGATIMLIPIITLAAAASYTSTLYISPGSTHTGAVRDYTNTNHKISIRADSFPAPELSQKLVIRIGTKGIFGDFKSKATKVASLSLGKTTTTYMGNIGSGKKLYSFSSFENAATGSGGTGAYYSGVNSDYVKMQSY